MTLQYYREQNADLFDAWEQAYLDKTYTLYTDSLSLDYALLSQLASEYDTVAGYGDFLDSVQTKAGQLAGISIFQNDETGYDLKNIEVTAAVYAGLGETAIDYYPQKGLYTAISYAFTDLILLASMLVLALLLVRQERDSGLLSLVRSLPGGRPANGAGETGRVCAEPAGRAGAFVRRQPRLLRRDVRSWPADPHDPERARLDALHDADHGRGSIYSAFCWPSGPGRSSWGCGSCWRHSLPVGRLPDGRPPWPGRCLCLVFGKSSRPPVG